MVRGWNSSSRSGGPLVFVDKALSAKLRLRVSVSKLLPSSWSSSPLRLSPESFAQDSSGLLDQPLDEAAPYATTR